MTQRRDKDSKTEEPWPETPQTEETEEEEDFFLSQETPNMSDCA